MISLTNAIKKLKNIVQISAARYTHGRTYVRIWTLYACDVVFSLSFQSFDWLFVLIVLMCSDQDIVWFITTSKYLNELDLSIAVEFTLRETSLTC